MKLQDAKTKKMFLYPSSISVGTSSWSDATTASKSDDETGAISVVAASATMLPRKKGDQMSTIKPCLSGTDLILAP